MPSENTGQVQNDALKKPRRGRSFSLRHRFALLVLVCMVALAAFLFLPPLCMYQALRSDITTGWRLKHLRQLARYSAFGRVLARSYVSRQFRPNPGYGMIFALEEQQLWRGMKRTALAKYFGTPHAVDGSRDIWYVRREKLLRMLQRSEDPPRWQHHSWRAWNMCMTAEYDGDNRLLRLARSDWPGEVIPDNAELPAVPPEWTEALQRNPHTHGTAVSNGE